MPSAQPQTDKGGEMRTIMFAVATAAVCVAFGIAPSTGSAGAPLKPKVSSAVAFDVSKPLREVQPIAPGGSERAVVPEHGLVPGGNGLHERDAALQTQAAASTMPAPLFTFEGPSNQANFDIFGFRVNPPDPNGDVGQQNYVAMTNLTYAVYDKTGSLLYGPVDTGTLWQDFPIEDCTDPSGDPIVVYDDVANRWILTQFTTRGMADPTLPFYNCVAVSTTSDPLGSYYRYAFTTNFFFPDYPKYGIMGKGLYITTREFGPTTEYQIGVYAINRLQIEAGDPSPTVVSFYLVDGVDPLYLLGDGILPADQDGKRMPPSSRREYFAGTMDDGAFYGAPFDAINFFTANINWSSPAGSTFALTKQLHTDAFDSIYPCGGNPGQTSRDCLEQPGVPLTANNLLDILSYRQRPTFRLQYRNFGDHESLVTSQSVEARDHQAGMRWYELRNPTDPVIYQQGTWAPDDGIHRWMGSVGLDKQGNMAIGYSVVNGTDVFPGIRYAGRLAGDPLGDITQGEQTMQAGNGIQTTSNSRWGDYTSMNVDPKNDCTFYYMNEYYPVSGTPADGRPWHTRIGAFKFPGCK
jgi:hypothetical protein